MIAILPAAGKGTRMSDVAPGSKELLQVGGKAVLSRVLEEAQAAGLNRMVVVTTQRKQDVADFVEAQAGVTGVDQLEPTGLCPAVVLAGGMGPALVLLPDTIFFPHSPTSRIAQALSRGYDIAIAVERVDDKDVSRYGIIEWSRETGRISRILEKPTPERTPSRWAIAARFGLSTRTMFFLRERLKSLAGSEREIDLPPLLDEALEAGHAGLAIPLEEDERRLDCGNPTGYRLACEVLSAGL